MNSIHFRYGLAGVLLALFFSTGAYAACEWSDRIAIKDSECLIGGYTNRTWPGYDTAWVQSSCYAYGKVVAKIDRANATDWTVELTDGTRVNRSGTAGSIRGIHCCSDLSDLCNKADVVNETGCLVQFGQSDASTGNHSDGPERYCSNPSATADAAAGTCTINASCRVLNENTQAYAITYQQGTFAYRLVDDLELTPEGNLQVK